MRRVETQVGQQVYEWLFSAQAQNEMVGLAKLSAALFGTNGIFNGLSVTQTSVASMAVQVGPGEVYQLESLEATACGTLPANTANSIVKQGIQLAAVTTSTMTAPVTSGQSINYLIEAQYQDLDLSIDPTTGNTPVVLQFYNSSNPSTPWSGPNNTGSTSNTFRDGVVAIQVKAGVAATTGSQVTPSPDTGWLPVAVVTIAYGQSSITNSNISTYSGAASLPSAGLLVGAVQQSSCNISTAGGTSDALTGSYSPAIAALTNGMSLYVRATSANATTTPTFTPNSGTVTAYTIVKGNGLPLAPGDIAGAGHWIELQWDASLTKWVLLNPALGVSPPSSVVGTARTLKMAVATASSTATLTADEVVVETALGGNAYKVSGISKTINLATTGAGGMDTGTAPVSGYVALYLIYNPSTGASALLAGNCSGAVATPTYTGGNPVAGYTASALVSVWATNASGQFITGNQRDRKVMRAPVNVLSSGTATTNTSVSLSSAVPQNAVTVLGWAHSVTNNAAGGQIQLSSDPSGIFYTWAAAPGGATNIAGAGCFELELYAVQTLYYLTVNTSTSDISITGYTF